MPLSRNMPIADRCIACLALMVLAPLLSAQSPQAQEPAPQLPAPPSSPLQSANWKTYSFPAQGFSISFPKQPIEEKKSVPTAAGSFELQTYLAANDAGALYVGVCDYGDAVNVGDPDALLVGAKNGAVSRLHGHLVSSKKIALGEFPGVELEATAGDTHLFGRIYLVGSTLYQEFAALSSNRPFPEIDRFLDSFQIIPRSAP